MVSSLSRRFCRRQKLSGTGEFSSVFKEPVFKQSSSNFLLLANCSQEPLSRLGIIVSKKNFPRAVDRNRIKRLMREVFRNQTDTSMSHKLDIVFLAKKRLREIPSDSLYKILDKQLRLLLKKTENLDDKFSNTNISS